MSDPTGVLFSPWQLEQAVISTLQTPPVATSTFPLLVYYLASVERNAGLPAQTIPQPPGPSSYRGGVDDVTLMAEWFPMLTVIAEPVGSPKRLDQFTYGQDFEVQVVSVVGDDDENVARQYAKHYGTAIAGAILDHADLGIGATQTILTRYPTAALLNPISARQVCKSTVMFTTYIAPVLTTGIPMVWPNSPYTVPTDWPVVTSETVVVNAVPESQQPLGTSG